MDEAGNIAVERIGRNSGAPRGFDLAAILSHKERSLDDDRPLVRRLVVEHREGFAVRGVEPIDVRPLGRETPWISAFSRHASSAAFVARARQGRSPTTKT